MPKVSFEMEATSVEIAPGQTIYDAAAKAGIALNRGMSGIGGCGGNGTCFGMGCEVYLRTPDPAGAATPPTWKERWLHRSAIKNRKRMACQCSPLRDLTVVTNP